MQAAVPGCFVKRWWGRGPQKSPPETFVRGLAVPPCSTPVTMPKKDPKKLCAFWGLISVPVVGVEPTRCHHQRILSPSRLPILTHRHIKFTLSSIQHPILKIKSQFPLDKALCIRHTIEKQKGVAGPCSGVCGLRQYGERPVIRSEVARLLPVRRHCAFPAEVFFFLPVRIKVS